MNVDNRLKKLEEKTRTDDMASITLKQLDQTDPEKAAYIRQRLVEKRMDKKPYTDKIVKLWAKYLKRRVEA